MGRSNDLKHWSIKFRNVEESRIISSILLSCAFLIQFIRLLKCFNYNQSGVLREKSKSIREKCEGLMGKEFEKLESAFPLHITGRLKVKNDKFIKFRIQKRQIIPIAN